MKGLLVKDIMIIKSQVRVLSFIIAVGIIFMCAYDNITMGVSYITFVISFLTIGSISYDEADNGMPFLFTLPVTKKTYVQEKYVFAIIAVFAGYIASIIPGTIILLIKSASIDFSELILTTVGVSAIVIVMLSFVLPAQIRYGAEKGKIVVFIVGGIVMLLGFFGSKFIDGTDISIFLDDLFSQGEVLLIIIGTLICVLIILISEKISEKLIQKREY